MSVFPILVLLRAVPDSSRYILPSLKDGRKEQRKPLHTLAVIVCFAFLPMAFVSLKTPTGQQTKHMATKMSCCPWFSHD